MMSRTYQFRTHINTIVKDMEHEFPGIPICRERRLVLDEEAIAAMKAGQKSYAIRFKPRSILVPEGINGGPWMPYHAAKEESQSAKAGYVRINEIVVVHAAMVTEHDAREGGFLTHADMMRRISGMHECAVQDDDFLSMYRLATILA